MTREQLELRFHDEMLEIYRRAKAECNYPANRFLQMVSQSGGLNAAQALLAAPGVSVGFAALWRCGRLDLTVEALVLSSPWTGLFTEGELSVAKRRLEELGYVAKQ
jgi:hypothetical protein